MPWPRSTKSARVPKGNLYSADCPTRIILDDVMSRWGSLVIVLLRERSYRFSELAYLIGGVSEKMLAQTLRRLEMDGFVHREVLASKPPKVEYSLTPLGCELSEHVHGLLSFLQKRADRVIKNRERVRRRDAEMLGVS
jgi:DNA-binding HxlR family transcriptional regulator